MCSLANIQTPHPGSAGAAGSPNPQREPAVHAFIPQPGAVCGLGWRILGQAARAPIAAGISDLTPERSPKRRWDVVGLRFVS